jgi:hypothetical protein
MINEVNRSGYSGRDRRRFSDRNNVCSAGAGARRLASTRRLSALDVGFDDPAQHPRPERLIGQHLQPKLGVRVRQHLSQ